MQYLAFGLLLLSWLNPLHIGPWVSWHNEALAFGAASLLAFAVLSQSRKKSASLRIPASAMIWLVWVAVVLIQVVAGQIVFLGDGILLVLYGLSILAVVTSGYSLGRVVSTDQEEVPVLRQLASVVLLGALLSSVVAIIQTLDIWSDSEWISRAYSLRRPGGNLAQPNQLATLQLMGIVSLNYLVTLRKFKGASALMVCVLLLAGLGLTESRSGVVSVAVLVVFAFSYRQYALRGSSSMQVVAGFVFLIICFKYLPLFSLYLQQTGMPQPAQLATNLSAGSRLIIWPQLIEATLQHSWQGWGLGQVPMAHNAVLHQYSVGETFTYAHNIVLDLVLGVGYPLAIAAVGLFIYWLVRRLRKIEDASTWYCLALLIPLVVHSLLEFPFAYAYFLVPVALAIGVLEARLFPEKYIEVKWVYAGVGHAVFAVVLLWSAWEYIQIEEDFRVARFEALRIGKTPASYDRPHIVLLTQLDAMLTGIRLVPTPSMSAENIESARKVAMRFPWPATQNRYALSLALNGNPSEATRQLKVTRAMHGEKTYQGIKASWQELAHDKFPQLAAIELP